MPCLCYYDQSGQEHTAVGTVVVSVFVFQLVVINAHSCQGPVLRAFFAIGLCVELTRL